MIVDRIWSDFLTEDEQAVIGRGREQLEEAYGEAYQELLKVIPKELENLAENAFVNISTAGECNGFQAGFYYAVNMLEDLRAESRQYYKIERR